MNFRFSLKWMNICSIFCMIFYSYRLIYKGNYEGNQFIFTQISSLTLPVAFTKVAPYSTTTPPYYINFNLSPGLKAGKPL